MVQPVTDPLADKPDFVLPDRAERWAGSNDLVKLATEHYLGQSYTTQDLGEMAHSGDFRGEDPDRVRAVVDRLTDIVDRRGNLNEMRNIDTRYAPSIKSALNELMRRLDSVGTVHAESPASRLRRHAEYNLAQPWPRRPAQLYKGNDLDAVESAYRRLRRRQGQIPEEQVREAKQQLDGIRGMYRADHDIYPVRTRLTDIYGDFTDTLMEYEPTPEEKFKADPVAHLMNKTGGRSTTHAMPQVGEENLIGRSGTVLIFEDGSGYDPFSRKGMVYAPESSYVRGEINRLLKVLDERGPNRLIYGDVDALRRILPMRRRSRRPSVDFWEDRMSSLVGAVDEYKEQSGGNDKAQIRGAEYRGATRNPGYQSRRGRGALR